jgi:dienelactone hydrolase
MTPQHEHSVMIRTGGIALESVLGLPADPRGVVVFAHGSGSGRLSPRNTFVARHLQQDGLATLLLDLLTEEEADDRRNVFDIDLLANRLLLAKSWLEAEPCTQHLRIGYFGASTGAGAALQAAAREPSNIKAVVSRGGRPDLAEAYLLSVGHRPRRHAPLRRTRYVRTGGGTGKQVVSGLSKSSRITRIDHHLRTVALYIPRPPKWTDLRTRGTKP